MDIINFDVNGVTVCFRREPSKKAKSGYNFSGEYFVGDYSFPILSVSHFLTLLFKFNNLEV